MKKIILILVLILLTSCSANKDNQNYSDIISNSTDQNEKVIIHSSPSPAVKEGLQSNIINESGGTIKQRFKVPKGFVRVEVLRDSYGDYIRNLDLKPHGSEVKYFDGRTKNGDFHQAVIDIDVGERDLQQCADAAMRIRAEYLYSKGLYNKIKFNFVNGFTADYKSWMEGKRIVVEGNRSYWINSASSSNDYKTFRNYLDMVFAYAGTLSLLQEMPKVPVDRMKIGNVFLDEGHCVIVVDMAQNKQTGEKIFMLAQSYMPAQDIHILKNPNNISFSPWYLLDFGNKLNTPQWTFERNTLHRFSN